MSKISGVCYWDGRPIGSSEIASLAGIDPQPVTGNVIVPQSGVALHAEVLRFDRHSAAERQPYSFGGGSVLTWDGRLDNRGDLLTTLHHSLSAEASDAAIVAAAYARWGDDCWTRLLGDWGLALWDASRRVIILARDYMGNRPLYYHTRPDGLAWGNHLEELATYRDVHDRVDDTYLAGTLTYGIPPEITPFAGVRALRAGHVLVASASAGVSIRRYWEFSPLVVRHSKPRDYEHQLRHLLFESVQVRLRAERPVWAHLSGGFDSSSIVCIADALVKRGLVDAPVLKPVSIVASGSPESDETEFIEPVECWCGLEPTRLEFEGYYDWDELQGRRTPVAAGPRSLLERPAQGAGDTVILSGQMGDLVMWKSGQHRLSLIEPLHNGHPLQFLRLLLTRARYTRQPIPSTLFKLGVQTYLPSVRRAFLIRRNAHMRALRTPAGRTVGATDMGVTPELLARAPRPEDTVYPSVKEFPFIKQDIVRSLYYFSDSDTCTTHPMKPDVVTTYPYAHRPLVEFVLATPQLVFWDPNTPRVAMKRALAELLPPALLQRRTKGAPASALNRGKRLWLEAFRELPMSRSVRSWQLVQRGAIDPVALDYAIAEPNTGTPDRRIDFVMRCVHLEAWLRTMDDVVLPSRSSFPPRAEWTEGQCAANA